MLDLGAAVEGGKTYEDGVGNPVNYHEPTGNVINRPYGLELNSKPTM